jgi:ATP-dependent helicase/nuclease subunit A
MQDTAAKSATVYITKPKFLKDGKSDSENKREFTGKEVGDAMHHLMELIPIEEIRRASDSEEMKQIVENTIENLFDRKKITEPEHYILTKAENMNAVEKVVKFFQGSLGQRMLKSDKVVREQPFFAILKGNNLGLCHESEVSLQGRTDMYFYEDGEIVLVDYKTDSPKSLNNELENYAKQLIMYKDILPKTTGRKVKQMYLYGFSQGKEIDVEKDITREKNE